MKRESKSVTVTGRNNSCRMSVGVDLKERCRVFAYHRSGVAVQITGGLLRHFRVRVVLRRLSRAALVVEEIRRTQ